MPPSPGTAGTRALALLPLALAFLAHLPGLWSGLVWDDVLVVEQTLFFGGLRDVLEPPAGIPGWSDAYYRPVVVLTYLLDFGLLDGRDAPLVPHLSNLLFHGATTGFVAGLARRCFGRDAAGTLAALATAAVFAVHPMHVESVNWISGRSDVLAALLLLPAVLLALRWRDTGSAPALGGAATLLFLALLAKEVAVAGLVIVPAAWLLVPGPDGSAAARPAPAGWPRLARGFLALLVAVGAYAVLRLSAGTIRGTVIDIGPATAVAALARAATWYLQQLVVPWPRGILVTWEMLPAWTDAALAMLAVAGLAAWAAARWWRSGDGVPLLALAWVLASLVPSLWIALVYTTTGPVSERYLYLPSVGGALAAGWLLRAALATPAPAWRRPAAIAVAVLVVGAGLALSLQRGSAWTSNLALWSDATRRLPDRAFPWISLARAWRAAGDPEQAFHAYRRALVSEPVPRQRARAIAGIAELHLDRGELEQAEREFDRAEREDPSFAYPTFGLGLVGMAKSRAAAGTPAADASRRRAEREFESLLAGDPRMHESRLALAELAADEARELEREGSRARARERYAVAIRELDELQAWLPGPRLEAYLRVTGEHLEGDVTAFRARLEEAVRRLDAGPP